MTPERTARALAYAVVPNPIVGAEEIAHNGRLEGDEWREYVGRHISAAKDIMRHKPQYERVDTRANQSAGHKLKVLHHSGVWLSWLFEWVGFGELLAVVQPLDCPQQCNNTNYGYGNKVKEAKTYPIDGVAQLSPGSVYE